MSRLLAQNTLRIGGVLVATSLSLPPSLPSINFSSLRPQMASVDSSATRCVGPYLLTKTLGKGQTGEYGLLAGRVVGRSLWGSAAPRCCCCVALVGMVAGGSCPRWVEIAPPALAVCGPNMVVRVRS